MMRCWQEPGVCDHAFVQSMSAAEDYVCDEHHTKEEREKELFEKAKEDYMWYKKHLEKVKEDYMWHKKHVKALEEKYPSLKDLD